MRLLGEMKKRQMEFIRLILRQKAMYCLLLTGKIDGKESKVRPRQMYLQSISQDLGISHIELIYAVNDSAKWMTMTKEVHNGHDTQ